MSHDFYDPATGDLVFKTSNTERMRLKADGTGTGMFSGSLPSAAYRIITDGTNVYAYNNIGTIIYSGLDAGAAVTACLPAASSVGATIIFRNDGFKFPWASVPHLPKGITGRLTIEGNGSYILQQTGGLTFLTVNRTTDYDTFQNIWINNFVIDRNNISAGGTPVVIGTQVGGMQRININHWKITRISSINVPITPSTPQNHYDIDTSQLGAGESTQNTITDIMLDQIYMLGGDSGVVITAGGGVGVNVFLDEINITNWHHDTLVVPTGGVTTGSNIHIGSWGFGDRCYVAHGYGANSTDVGIEIDTMMRGTVEDVEIVDAWNDHFLYYNFQAPIDFNGQVGVWQNTKSRVKNLATTAVNYNGYRASSASTTYPWGQAVLDGEFVGSNMGLNGNSHIAFWGANQPVKEIIIKRLLVDCVFNDSSTGTTFNNILNIFPTVDCILSIEKLTYRLSGTTSNTSANLRLGYLSGNSSTLTVDLDRITVDSNITGIGAGKTQGFYLGSTTGTMRGRVRGFRVLQWAVDTSPTVWSVAGTSTLTIDGRFVFRDCDHTHLPSGATEWAVDATQTALGAVFTTGNIWRTKPSPTNLTGLVTTTGKILGSQAATIIWPCIAVITQGSGSAITAIDFSTNNGTTYTNKLTQASGAIPAGFDEEIAGLTPDCLIKATFTGTQPTITLVPLNP